jgi:chromosome segregation ATPase
MDDTRNTPVEQIRRAERAADAAGNAAQRADEARTRIREIDERLRTLRKPPARHAGTADDLRDARQAAEQATRHRSESTDWARRAHRAAVEVHENAARAHDAAAAAHERVASAGLGDVEGHRQLSRYHREHAASDRAAGIAELDRLRQRYPDER